ncbi:MAG: cysteine desulfurase family protein [Bacteroidota bacterium]
MRVYLDNAATTPLDPAVFEAMKPYLLEQYGNPSSTHSHGRSVRAAIEYARKSIATMLKVTPGEIFFTSGGTEADNTALVGTIHANGVKHVVSSPIEHHAVLHTLETLERNGEIKLSMVELDAQGRVNYDNLQSLLAANPNTLVSLMHANNEIGTLMDLKRVAEMAKEHGGFFHSDTVQTMGHYVHDLTEVPADCIVGSAHKFHGPKGIGFLFLRKGHKCGPFIHGGSQERNMRGGTENVAGIIGIAKALEIAYEEMEAHRNHVQGLKTRMITQLKDRLPEVSFNGTAEDPEESLYTVLNVCLPPSTHAGMMLFSLDLHQISASGGSACSSGSQLGSHVLQAIGHDPNRPAVRFSFSKFNTAEEIDYTVDKIVEIYQPVEA